MNVGPSRAKSKNRQPQLLGRKQEIDLRLNQVIDAILLERNRVFSGWSG
jgi:hypothetical protein